MKKTVIPSWLRFFAAGLLCLIAAYLTEPTLGAVAALPFIIIFPIFAYIVYRKALPLIGLSALGAFLFKAMITEDTAEIFGFALKCALFAAISVVALKHFGFAKKLKVVYRISSVITIILCSSLIYSLLHGTFWGNLSSKEVNENFISNTYPDVEFTVGSTFYSAKDRCYLTEAVFRDKEVYRAYFSANKDGSEEINGYRDYCEARLLESGTTILGGYLSSLAHEGEDFALRRDRIDTDKRLTSKAQPEEFYGDMCYEIAFYDMFYDEEAFEVKCREYAEFIPEDFRFSTITFFGFGDGDDDDFEYSLKKAYSSQDFTVTPFDPDEFSRYGADIDTHRYWSIIK